MVKYEGRELSMREWLEVVHLRNNSQTITIGTPELRIAELLHSHELFYVPFRARNHISWQELHKWLGANVPIQHVTWFGYEFVFSREVDALEFEIFINGF